MVHAPEMLFHAVNATEEASASFPCAWNFGVMNGLVAITYTPGGKSIARRSRAAFVPAEVEFLVFSRTRRNVAQTRGLSFLGGP